MNEKRKRIALGFDWRGRALAEKVGAFLLGHPEQYDLVLGGNLFDFYAFDGNESDSENTFGGGQKFFAASVSNSLMSLGPMLLSASPGLSVTFENKKKSKNDAPLMDYTEVTCLVIKKILANEADVGILIGGTGVGMCVLANKFTGIRAALCANSLSAELSRKHNNANVLCLSGGMLGEGMTLDLIQKWLVTPFDGGRHAQRIEKISKIEQKTGL